MTPVDTLPAFIRALLEPRAYPEGTRSVELVQTHISYVLLADDYVYKVKKPVNFGFVDYSTLEKRRTFCQREVELNRRLCPGTYLGVVPIVPAGASFVLGGKGAPVEYAVKMRRLPAETMMDRLLGEHRVTPAMVRRVARKLARFHAQALTSPEISNYGGMDILRQNTEENFAQTEPYVGRTISPAHFRSLTEYTRHFLAKNRTLFQSRVEGGRIRDCHGDVHSANICFAKRLCIYDCIEFNERFRYSDTMADIAFLAMDLDYHCRRDLSVALADAYRQASGDVEGLALLDYYKCYRAYVRGKVESFRLDDPHQPGEEKERAQRRAQGYFHLAYAYTRPALSPTLFITTGLMGTGKSTLAQSLARRLGLTGLSSDVTRKRLAGVGATERKWEPFAQGIYSLDFTRRTYDALLQEAGQLLKKGHPVIIDASFKKAEERRRALALAQRMGAQLWLLECLAPETELKKRLDKRSRGEPVPSDGRWEILREQKEDYEPPVEIPPGQHIRVDTSQPREVALEQAMSYFPRQQ